jgi:hypothetical protein
VIRHRIVSRLMFVIFLVPMQQRERPERRQSNVTSIFSRYRRNDRIIASVDPDSER